MLTTAQAVDSGVTWLDGAMPDWREHIDTADLDMANSTRCILAQVYGLSYWSVKDLYRPQFSNWGWGEWCAERGFTLHRDLHGSPARWHELRSEWVSRLGRVDLVKR